MTPMQKLDEGRIDETGAIDGILNVQTVHDILNNPWFGFDFVYWLSHDHDTFSTYNFSLMEFTTHGMHI